MASNGPRKRKQDLTHIRGVEKCPRVEENDSQEVFCVDSDCEVDDGDCIVVSEKIIIKRGRCQNPACLSPEGTKLQKASRRVQDFYGHSCKKGRIWRICDVCYTKAEEHLGKLKNNFINRVPVVGSQFPFYGEMVALEEEDSTDDDEEPLDDTVAEFMSNCASDMINTIFEKYDINFQVEEGVKKLLEGYEKVESEIEAQIKSCEEMASTFRSSCDDFYKENEYYREELPAVEIDSGSEEVTIAEEVTIDDNSDGDDIIVVESVRSLQNMPEELNENTSFTQSQSQPVCPNESSVTEQTSEIPTILPDVSHATATNNPIFGELRTIVKLSGGNSASSSRETGVVNGYVPDKRICDKQSVPVDAGGMLRDSNTKAPGKDSVVQKHQTLTEGRVTESTPIHCVPLQQLLQQGLSVLGTQPGNTNMREKDHNKEQQSSSQVSHTNDLLHKHLQQRFSVLSPSTGTASTQEKHQHEAHQLHGYTAPVSQQSQVVGNVPSMQQQQQYFSQIPHNAINQQSRQQIPQTSQQSSGYYMPQPPQQLSEQRIQQVPPQPTGYTPPHPNLPLTPQNSMQLMSRTSLQQSGQHVTPGAQDSSARNTYLTSTPQLPPQLSEKSAFLHSQPGRQSLACAQQQPGGYVSQTVQQPTGHVPQPVQQPAVHISSPVQQPTGHVSQPVQQPTGHVSQPVQQPAGHVSRPVQQPAGHVSRPVQQPAGHVSRPVQQPAGHVSRPVQQPAGHVSRPVQQPAGHVSRPVQQPAGHVSRPVQQPAGNVSRPVQQPTGNVSRPVQQPTGNVSRPVQQPTGNVSRPVQQPTGNTSRPVQQPTGNTSRPVQQPAGNVSRPVQQPAGNVSRPVQQPAGNVSRPVQQPAGNVSRPVQQPAGNVSIPAQQPTGNVSRPVQQPSGNVSRPVQQPSGNVSRPLQQPAGNVSRPVQQPSGNVSKSVQQPGGHYSLQSLQQSSGKFVSNNSQSVVQLQVQSESKIKSLPHQQSSAQYFYQTSQQQVVHQINNRCVSQPSKEQVPSGALTTQEPNFVNTTMALQTSIGTTSLKTPPTVQCTLTDQTTTQHTLRLTDSTMVHQNMQERENLATGQISHQSKVLHNRETGSLPQQHQTGKNVPQSAQCPAGQASLVVSQQSLQLTPQQDTAQKPLQSANHIIVQSESQKPLQSSVNCGSLSPQLTNRVIQHSRENNATQSPIQPNVGNMSNTLVQQSRQYPPQVLQNSSVTSLPSSSQPNVPSLSQTLQQDIRQTVQIVSQTQFMRQSILPEPQNRQTVTVNQETKNEEHVAKTHQQLTCQTSGQDAQKSSQICNSQLAQQCPQKQSEQPVSQSGKQMVSQFTYQNSGQNVTQISTMYNQRQTSQSVRDLCEQNSLKLQQQHKQEATSHVVLTGDTTHRRDTNSYLPRPSESSAPQNTSISSKIVHNPHSEAEPPKKQDQVVSELGIKQSQQQQKQYNPSSSSQEPLHHTSLTKSDTGSHQAYSKSQAQDSKNHVQSSEDRTQQSLNKGVLLQNMSQPLQHLKTRQSEKTELKVQPVIPLQKSQSSDQEGRPQHSNQQMSSTTTVSQVVPQQLHSFSTNQQIPANVSQQSVVSQFPGNLFVMLQQQQVTMMLGFVCDILSRFLPMVTQQQCQKESTQVAVAPPSVNTSISQEQNSKVIPNKNVLRLPEKDRNEISDTESMCQSPVDSSTPFSTPTKSLFCTSPSTLSSSTDSDISVSDSIEVCAEKDVVTVGKIVIKESNLPPLGLVNRPPVLPGDSMYIMNDIKRPWILATVRDIVTQNNQTLYTVEFTNFKNKQMKETKKVAGFQLAYSQVQDFRFSVGHRIISIFRDGISDEDYYSGVIAEPPKSINRYRYLVFFDNGGSQYVKHQDIRLVVESSPSVWEDVHIEIREFVQNYLEKYPERALLKVQEGQEVRTEWNRRWYNAKVLKVDASLARMSFPSIGKHVEWIYRGSARFYPLFEAQNRVSKEQFARSKAFARKKGDPYIQYTLKEEEELDKEIKDEHEAASDESEPSYRSTARKSTTQLTAQYPRLAPKRIFYPCYSQVTYTPHRCKPSCVINGNPEKDYANYRNLLSHLSEPMLHGWTREKVKHSEYVSVYYRAPCKRRLRNIEELHKYLLQTKSKLTVDQFDFDHWVRCFTEGINEKYFVKIEDISNGVEAVPVPCINSVDSRKPEEITYVTKHVPTNGTYIETDPEFLICCDCTDDCLDKEKCACWRQTMEGVKYGPESESPNHEGYYYKRLYEPLVTGIYECNSRCKCSSTCLNRLVQLPMKCKVQVFMTPNRGWGIRALHDIPKGSFICLYAGHVLSEKVGDALAKEVGDEYQADLDYIESAEKVKEDYEEDPYENELEEDCGKKQNTKQKGQTTASRKSACKQPKIVAPSTRVLFGRNGRYILDAKTCGNVGRFINHSCNANLFAQNVFVDTHDLRFPWVAFFTNSFVPANTELTWNYGYDVDSVPERVIICKCGEANCQGRLL